MKKAIRTMIVILTAGFMLMAFAACEEKKDDTGKDDAANTEIIMKAVFENITSSDRYKEWKQMNPEATIQEKLYGNTITFTVESSIDTDSIKEEDVTNDMPVSSGEYVFTFDGDYIVYKAQDAKRTSNPFSTYILSAICDYYGMNWVTANEYICAHPDNTYYIIDTDANTIKIYAVNNWKMD